METGLAILSGVLMAGAVYLMLSANLLRFLFGLLMISNAVNLAIFACGRLTLGLPPLLGPGGTLPEGQMANALPQALLLTAIVIGFGLFSFALVLVVRAFATFNEIDGDRLRTAEPDEGRS